MNAPGSFLRVAAQEPKLTGENAAQSVVRIGDDAVRKPWLENSCVLVKVTSVL